MDLRLKRLQHPRPRHPLIARRRLAAQRPADRVPRQARRPGELLDRLAANEVFPPQLSPLLHTDHPLAAFLIANATSLDGTPDSSADRPGGQFSNGGEGSVFTRRRTCPCQQEPASNESSDQQEIGWCRHSLSGSHGDDPGLSFA